MSSMSKITLTFLFFIDLLSYTFYLLCNGFKVKVLCLKCLQQLGQFCVNGILLQFFCQLDLLLSRQLV